MNDNNNDNDEKVWGVDIALQRAAHIGDASSSTTNDGYHILGTWTFHFATIHAHTGFLSHTRRSFKNWSIKIKSNAFHRLESNFRIEHGLFITWLT